LKGIKISVEFEEISRVLGIFTDAAINFQQFKGVFKGFSRSFKEIFGVLRNNSGVLKLKSPTKEFATIFRNISRVWVFLGDLVIFQGY
jgi:hypothetical protein